MVISELISYKSKLSNGIKTWNLNFAFFVVFIFFWSLLKSFTNVLQKYRFCSFLDHETACRRNGADFAYEARFA